MRFFGAWTILVALTISVTAAYYSIVGLVAIFAASALPVIIMGATLEVGKITTAIWLHLFWDRARFLIKTYLSFALVLLMFITSMGIFGFLSKAHIEQTAVAVEGQAQLERIETEISRATDEVTRAEAKIVKLETSDDNADAAIQEKITTENNRIQAVYDRLTSDIDLQNQSLDATIAPYTAQAEEADRVLALINQFVAEDDIRALQGLIGARQDGRYGPKTAEAVQAFREKQEADRDAALAKIAEARASTQEEIRRLRELSESSVAQSNQLIDRLRSQLGTTSDADVEADIQEQRQRIREAETRIDELLETKYDIEAEARKLEAEVGPVKYIAELVYGDNANSAALEEAVRWVIIILVIVFDPLAVVLVIAGLTLFEAGVKAKRNKEIENDISSTLLPVEENTGPEKIREDQPSYEEKSYEAPSVTFEVDPDPNFYTTADPVIELDSGVQVKASEIAELNLDTVVLNGMTQREINEMIREQLALNQKTRNIVAKNKISSIVNKMKADGQWPSVPTERIAIKDIINADNTGELEELLERADEDTIREVLEALMKDQTNKSE